VQPEETVLVNRLLKDGMVDENRGFTVTRSGNELAVNGTLLSDAQARKYLDGLRKPYLRVEVHPFIQRMAEHPDSNLLQVAAPMEYASPCVETSARPGC
jgi:ubiquinone biosynthesis protein UbiJ